MCQTKLVGLIDANNFAFLRFFVFHIFWSKNLIFNSTFFN